MFVIGLAGGSGSGKSIVSNVFREAGYFIYDTDKIYHEMTSVKSDCTLALADAFGDDILFPNGSLDRRRLADIVFNETCDASEARHMLNRIAHSHVSAAFRKYLDGQTDGVVVLDAPLLFEAGMEKMCDITVAVIADRLTRIERIMMRDGITRSQAERRIAAQKTDDEFRILCDYCLVNNGTPDELISETNDLINIINKRINDHE